MFADHRHIKNAKVNIPLLGRKLVPYFKMSFKTHLNESQFKLFYFSILSKKIKLSLNKVKKSFEDFLLPAEKI